MELLFMFITAILVENVAWKKQISMVNLEKKLELFIGQSKLIIRDLPNVPVEAVKLLIEKRVSYLVIQ